MKKFRMLFYKPVFFTDGKYVDGAIAFWTRIWNLDAPKELICSHQENWTPNKDGNFDAGKCWTSTMGAMGAKGRTGSGVCCRPAAEVLKHPGRWFYAEFETTDEQYEEMLQKMKYELIANTGYDRLMILNFFIPLGIGDKDKWICSEFCNHFGKIGLWPEYVDIVKKLNDKMSPLRSAKTLHKCGVSFYNLDGSLLLAA